MVINKAVLYDKNLDKFYLDKGSNLDNIILDSPLSIGWLITGKCNLNCIHCYGNEEELPNDIDYDQMKKVAENIINSGIKRVSISGGEPTIKKDLFKIIKLLSDNDISVILSTNGLFVKDDIIGLESLRHIEISLDGSEEKIHEIFRPARGGIKGISFNNAITALEYSVKSGTLTRVLTTLNLYNKEDLFNIGYVLEKIGVQEWHIGRTVRAGRARFIYDKLNTFDFNHEQIIELQEKFPNIKIQFNYPSKTSNYYVLILPNGNITTQNNITGEKIELGSLLDKEILYFWKNENYDKKGHLKKWLNIE